MRLGDGAAQGVQGACVAIGVDIEGRDLAVLRLFKINIKALGVVAIVPLSLVLAMLE